MAVKPVRKLSRNAHRLRVHRRIRQRILGTIERPRLCVYRSLGHIYAQVIDDHSGSTLASASSLDKQTPRTDQGRQQCRRGQGGGKGGGRTGAG